MSQNEGAQVTYTKEGLDAIVEVLPVLRQFGFRTLISIPGCEKAGAANAVALGKALGIQPASVAWASPGLYEVIYRYREVDFGGFLCAGELPSIGYHLVDGNPVPIDQTA